MRQDDYQLKDLKSPSLPSSVASKSNHSETFHLKLKHCDEAFVFSFSYLSFLKLLARNVEKLGMKVILIYDFYLKLFSKQGSVIKS